MKSFMYPLKNSARALLCLLVTVFSTNYYAVAQDSFEETQISHCEYEPLDLSSYSLASSCSVNDLYDYTDECIKWVNLSFNFIGDETFTATGNHSSSLPADYNAYDFSEALIDSMNNRLQYNQPANICNGWLYNSPFMYDDNEELTLPNPVYNPDNYMPDPDWAGMCKCLHILLRSAMRLKRGGG